MAKTSHRQTRRMLCNLLVQAREQANFTQKQVAETGIITQSEISKIENGQRKVDFILLVKLAELYKKPLEYFKPKKQ